MARFYNLIFLTIFVIHTESMMMRNKALMSKMVSKFQKDNPQSQAYEDTNKMKQLGQDSPNVMPLMQNVLCKNFPSIPCDVIKHDATLNRLIERSVQQLKYKKLSMSMDRSTSTPGYQLTLFPTINSEDLSNFLIERDPYNKAKPATKPHTNKHQFNEPKETKKSRNNSHKTITNRKKIHKFYPRKLKYKDKNTNRRREYPQSEENLSMSVEPPEHRHVDKKRLNYEQETEDNTAWRLDYQNQGNPDPNMYRFEPERFQEKITKTGLGRNVIIEDNLLDGGHQSRKEVLHPDVYIKNNFVRKLEMD